MTLFLIETAAKATVVLALAGLFTVLLRRSAAATRHLVWTAALVAALLVPLMALSLPRWEVPVLAVTEHAPAVTAAADDEASMAMAARMLERLRSFERATEPVFQASATGVRSLTVLQVLAAVWVGGAGLVIGRLLLGLLAVALLGRRTERADAAPWLPLAQALARELGISRITFRRSSRAAMPIAWGLWRPTVMMPAAADTWTEERLRIVLLHELAHVKRRDCLTHVIAQVACAVYWFHPLAWIAARRLRSERERACDDLVLAAGTEGADYADQLLDIARAMRAERFPSVMASASLAMAQRSQLEGRLMAILDPTVPRTGMSRSRLLAASVVAVAALVPLASLQAWGTGPQVPVQPAPAPVTTPAAESVAPVLTPAPAPMPAPRIAPSVAVEAVRESVHEAISVAVPVAVEAAVSGRGAQDPKRKADPKVVAALTAALQDTDKDVRETAMHALVTLRDPSVFEPLLAALKDASADVREQAAFGLGQMRDKRAVEPLLGATKDASDDVREQAAFALGQLKDQRATTALIALLKDTHANVREQAAFALGQLRPTEALGKDAVEALVVALKDANASVREQVAFALGQIKDPRAIDALTGALKDASANVRQQAAFALGQIAR